jgi:hypothetical protein
MLTVFRIVLPAALTPLTARIWGNALDGLRGGRFADGARKPLLGVVGADLVEIADGMLPVLLRVLVTGKAGSAMLGGPLDGREGRGSVVAIVEVTANKESSAAGFARL